MLKDSSAAARQAFKGKLSKLRRAAGLEVEPSVVHQASSNAVGPERIGADPVGPNKAGALLTVLEHTGASNCFSFSESPRFCVFSAPFPMNSCETL